MGHSRSKEVAKSSDELRLTGDYDQPADAVSIPTPNSNQQFRYSSTKVMLKKPGANSSFNPVDTLKNDFLFLTPSKGKTYASPRRTTRPPIGRTQHGGQEEFRRRTSANIHAIPVEQRSTLHKLTQLKCVPSPSKRRKVLHINLDADEVLEESSPVVPAKFDDSSSQLTPSLSSTRSCASIESDNSLSGTKSSIKSKSEFKTVDKLVRPKRKRYRGTKPIGSHAVQHDHGIHNPPASNDGRSHMQSGPIKVYGEDTDSNINSPTKSISKIFSQGLLSRSARSPKQNGQIDGSHRLTASSQMRINESTSVTGPTNRNLAKNIKELHKQFVPVPERGSIAEYSEDELAISVHGSDSKARKRPTPSSLMPYSAEKSQAKSHNNGPRKYIVKGSPLDFARSYEYNEGSVESKGNTSNFRLIKVVSGGWRVASYDDNGEGRYETKFELKPERVITARLDHTSRVRLEGSRLHDGRTRIYDLKFTSNADFHKFRDQHLKDLIEPKKPITVQDDSMALLFSKPLPERKPNHSLNEVDITEHESTIDVAQSKPSRASMWANAHPTRRSFGNVKKATDATGVVSALRASTRTKRPSTWLIVDKDLHEPADPKQAQAFSIVHGLGARWNKQLEYGEGRQKAVVQFDDLVRLDEGSMLNDSLVDFYMMYLFNQRNVSKNKVYCFNTYFYTQLKKDTGKANINYKAVERWTLKMDIFGYDYIVVPVNAELHWFLAIICNVANIDRKPSLEGTNIEIEDRPHDESNVASMASVATGNVGDVVKVIATPRVLDDSNGNDDVNHSDENLFDEDAKLRLLDRDAEDEGIGLAASERHREPTLANTTTGGIYGLGIAANTDKIPGSILSNLPASSDKRKAKRKPMQLKKDPTQPMIIILDSLGHTRSSTVRALKDWLLAEGDTKRGMKAEIKGNGYYPKAYQIPMQDNYSDCGVYLLGYLEKFFNDTDEFKTRLLNGEMSSKHDWPDLNPVAMRNNMREIIQGIATEKGLTKKIVKRPKKPEAMLTGRAGPSSPNESTTPKLSPSRSGVHVGNATQPFQTPAAPHTRLNSPRKLESGEPSSPSLPKTKLNGTPSDHELGQSPTAPDSFLDVISSDTSAQRTSRRNSPRVHVSFKTSNPQSFFSNSTENMATSASRTAHDSQPETASRPASSNKRSEQNSEGCDLRRPGWKKRVKRTSLLQLDQSTESISSSSLVRINGSASRPIAIDDSQERTPFSGIIFEGSQQRSTTAPERLLQTTTKSPSPQVKQSVREASAALSQTFPRCESATDEVDAEARRILMNLARQSPSIGAIAPRPLLTSPMRNDSQRTKLESIKRLSIESDGSGVMTVEPLERDDIVRETPGMEPASRVP